MFLDWYQATTAKHARNQEKIVFDPPEHEIDYLMNILAHHFSKCVRIQYSLTHSSKCLTVCAGNLKTLTL